jgi:hypothetical protein
MTWRLIKCRDDFNYVYFFQAVPFLRQQGPRTSDLPFNVTSQFRTFVKTSEGTYSVYEHNCRIPYLITDTASRFINILIQAQRILSPYSECLNYPVKLVEKQCVSPQLKSNGLVNPQINLKQHESLFKKRLHDTEQTLTSSSLLFELLSLKTR